MNETEFQRLCQHASLLLHLPQPCDMGDSGVVVIDGVIVQVGFDETACAALICCEIGEPKPAAKVEIYKNLLELQSDFVGRLAAMFGLDRVNERLAYILGYENLRPGNIRLAQKGDSFDILVGRSLLTTVTPADARANGTRNVRGLAGVWLRRLQHALPQARPLATVAALPTSSRIAQK